MPDTSSAMHSKRPRRRALVDAVQRCLAASEIAGVRGIVAHAIDDDAVRFYQRHGFVLAPLGERVMLMPVERARSLLET